MAFRRTGPCANNAEGALPLPEFHEPYHYGGHCVDFQSRGVAVSPPRRVHPEMTTWLGCPTSRIPCASAIKPDT